MIFGLSHSEKRVKKINLLHFPVCDFTWKNFVILNRKPNVSEYLPNVPKCGLNTRHDNREVTWSDCYYIFPKAEFVRILTECSEVRIEHTRR